MKAFTFDGAVFRALERVFDIMALHFLWIICSIPIVTIGASTAALCTVSLKIINQEEGYIFRGFLSAFKENFKKSTLIWIAFLSFFLWCIAMIAISFRFQMAGGKVLALLEASVLFLAFTAFQYVFFIQAKFENSIKNTIKNAFILSLKFLPYTIVMLAIIMVPVLATAYMTEFYALLLFLWIFFGSSGINLLQAFVINKVFTLSCPLSTEGKEVAK